MDEAQQEEVPLTKEEEEEETVKEEEEEEEEEEEDEEEEEVEAPIEAPSEAEVKRRISVSEYVGELLGMSTVTKDSTYLDARKTFENYEKQVKGFQAAVGLYADRLQGCGEAGASMRLLASQNFLKDSDQINRWAETRAGLEASYASAADSARRLEANASKYCALLKSTKAKTDAATTKARRDVDYYQKKVESLTKKLMASEKDLASRRERDERMRRTAQEKRQPPPEKTHYFFEDPLPVASEKLEKLKQRLARNEHKLEVAKVWADRSVSFGTLTFHTVVDENDPEVTHLLADLLTLDQTLKDAAEKLVIDPVPDSSTSKALAERISDARAVAGFDKTDVDPQSTLDHDDEDDVADSGLYLCGFNLP
mmetsp:Transcript_1447/g.4241  ORF Transcript_1447/g.4241 Transcript_1447/m.4241 type:complete len:368 (-) Transcript_1447:744-1847(-)|eukprot:CAMPEP_0198676648 /NCGR_PEP_ID=MMETSP1467-20131203/99024_1 /TAXON_ID=1462469 /ORGANISM="unid. sp., Strain CCMP2135" /LENGTH=367 /DNA_ID=CAMNT_0044413551 /DNA_START=63 /DNA_END=1166 /DNA_ORIENTATION=+